MDIAIKCPQSPSKMPSYPFANELAVPQSTSAKLGLAVKGFTPSERQLLDAILKLSQRRQTQLNLLRGLDEEEADVVMIDAKDVNALNWAHRNPWLARKVVIWVDAPNARGGYAAKRPIQWASLPMLLVRALEQVPAKAAGLANLSKSKSVLVVDDSVAVRGQLRALLERRGFSVTEVPNAESAIKLATNQTYTCILMDVLMDGMNGYDACRLIKTQATGGKKTNVVMLTSKTSPFDRIKGKMAGCDAYLTKPVNPEQLYEVISRFVAQPADSGVMPQQMSALQFAK
jgi:twitching motility two-component system response regulator PilG